MNRISTIESFTKPSPLTPIPSSSPSSQAPLTPPPNAILSIIGNWGPWQRRNVLLIFLCKIPAAWFMACIIFTAPFAEPNEFMCKEPYDGSSIVGYHSNTSSEVDICDLVFQNIEQNENYMNSNASISSCRQIRHESIFDSLVTSFDLVCSRKILVAVTQFFHLCGVLSGGILATKLLEIQSPRYVMLLGMITQIICGCLTGLVTDFTLHIFFRYLSAVCCALMYTAGLMIFSDITGGNYRTSVICLFESFWGIGVILLPVIAYLMPSWSWSGIYLAISLPTIAYAIAWRWIADSPVWLLKHGRTNEAKAYLLEAIDTNKCPTPQSITNLDAMLNNEVVNLQKQPKPSNWWSLWANRRQCILTLALHIAWAVDVTNYNGMLLNIRVFGREYLMWNTAFSGCSEILGILIAWLIVIKGGKYKFVYSGSFNIAAGCLSFLGFAFPGDPSEIAYVIFGMALALTSIAATTCSQAVLFTCTSTLVPVQMRPICTFSCVVFARICLLTAPFIGALTFLHNLFPLAAFGFLELCGGICSCIVYYCIRTQNKQKNENIAVTLTRY